jgi:predicted metal-dependent HD superfamily phosphohydrolase
MNWPGRARWTALWRKVGASGDSSPWYDRLTAAYGEPHRHYHNQQHIAECLAEFDYARHLARQPEAVELAIWFHDVVYEPKAGDNEERSAELAESCLAQAELPKTFVESVRKLVIATKHHEAEPGSDEAVMIDVDLSILGQGEKRFAEYEEQIRQEYGWVPAVVFASKRGEILEKFVARKYIFHTAFFRDKYEGNARRNLQASIDRLKGVCQ